MQQALVDHHASQCGFCTPALMSLFALYHATPAGCCASRDQAQQTLSGNLCRCTGRRPILDAAQTMGRWRPCRDRRLAPSCYQQLEHLHQQYRGWGRFGLYVAHQPGQLLALRAPPQAQLVAGLHRCRPVGNQATSPDFPASWT